VGILSAAEAPEGDAHRVLPPSLAVWTSTASGQGLSHETREQQLTVIQGPSACARAAGQEAEALADAYA